MANLTHFDAAGNAVMVDVSAKPVTTRMARARGVISMKRETLDVIQRGTAKKGDVLGAARLAGIMAAKKTAQLIPLCHSLNFDACAVDFLFPASREPDRASVEAECVVRLSAKTGAEMEALTGVSIALLTIYDMCKAIDRGMIIGGIHLEEKSGGAHHLTPAAFNLNPQRGALDGAKDFEAQ